MDFPSEADILKRVGFHGLARCGGQLSFSALLVQNLPESQRERAVICKVSRSLRLQGLLHRTLRNSWIIVVEGNSAIWTSPHPPNHRAWAESQLSVSE